MFLSINFTTSQVTPVLVSEPLETSKSTSLVQEKLSETTSTTTTSYSLFPDKIVHLIETVKSMLTLFKEMKDFSSRMDTEEYKQSKVGLEGKHTVEFTNGTYSGDFYEGIFYGIRIFTTDDGCISKGMAKRKTW